MQLVRTAVGGGQIRAVIQWPLRLPQDATHIEAAEIGVYGTEEFSETPVADETGVKYVISSVYSLPLPRYCTVVKAGCCSAIQRWAASCGN